MADITIRDDMDVKLWSGNTIGADNLIIQAAKVSTHTIDQLEDVEANYGFINFLMRNRHGSPFEHGSMTFVIRAPIFVWREFMRHRIGFSYNEQSARYMELQPEFYVPIADRPLQQVGKPGHYTFEPGTDHQQEFLSESLQRAYRTSWSEYKKLLEMGIAKEVARMCLPVAIYSSAFVTCNPRSLMSFLSLRTKDEGSKFPSYPQYEIELVALQMEEIFRQYWPLTHRAFVANGRVSP